MPIEQQVVSLELAKKLKELGVTQESLFGHYVHVNSGNECTLTEEEMHQRGQDFEWVSSAYTVAELGEMLPMTLECKNNGLDEILRLKIDEDLKGIWYRNADLDKARFGVEADTEADARAKMIMYLIENNLINPKGL